MRLIEIRLSKCTLFLTEEELWRLVSTDARLWEAGIRRGKAILRARKRKAREVNQRGEAGDGEEAASVQG